MTENTKYVEIRLGGGIPQFIPLDQWRATDPSKRAAYTVIHAELTEEEKRARETQLSLNAATTGKYSDEAAHPVDAAESAGH
jgi:hypothetical protein